MTYNSYILYTYKLYRFIITSYALSLNDKTISIRIINNNNIIIANTLKAITAFRYVFIG